MYPYEVDFCDLPDDPFEVPWEGIIGIPKLPSHPNNGVRLSFEAILKICFCTQTFFANKVEIIQKALFGSNYLRALKSPQTSNTVPWKTVQIIEDNVYL